MNFWNKFRNCPASLALTAVVIIAVLLLNVGVTAALTSLHAFGDLTSQKMYTLAGQTLQKDGSVKTEATATILKDTFDSVNEGRRNAGEEDVKVKIVFCADPDMLTKNDRTRYVYYTALAMEHEFPDTIEVTTTDVWKNPSSVDAYRTDSLSKIYQTNVIVASGSEFRVHKINSFYTFDPDSSDEPWAYSGEKIFIRSIIAVTKAEAPVCCLTTGHGEPFTLGADGNIQTEYTELLKVIEASGYQVQPIDLKTQDIPEKCRLILTLDPTEDFQSSRTEGGNGVSEISKLSKFLSDTYSYVVFFDADTPKLFHLEELLEEWGIAIDRYADDTSSGNWKLTSDSALDKEGGNKIIASYETEGMGGSVTEELRTNGGSPDVIFENAVSLSYSTTYETRYVLADADEGTGAYRYGGYFKNNASRSIYDVFRADKATAVFNGIGSVDSSEYDGAFRLMTLTRESRTIGEGQGYTTVNDPSYVCAFGSTAFVKNAYLAGNTYGNKNVLLDTFRTIGKEVVPVGMIGFRALYDPEMTQASSSSGVEYYTESGNRAWTVVLTVLPACVMTAVGTVFLVRRKFAA